MNDVDDRLAGDPVWELFPAQSARPRATRLVRGSVVAGLVVLTYFLSPPLSVGIACLAVMHEDLRDGWRLSRTMPDKAGGAICALFAYSWGAFKLGVAGFASMMVIAMIAGHRADESRLMAGLATAALLWLGGFTASSVLAAAGLVKALRSGMRVWIGEGVNQARSLLLGMLLTGFTYFVLGPLTFLLARIPPGEGNQVVFIPLFMLGFVACVFVAPVGILLVLDWACRKVLAERPAKFGPKVPAVGKWDRT
ncbi:hypothetical protein OJF2_31830 [Aquisphaera giovannonii]|uniref:Uncharacterized protein n=1 Tax=Aquisphaera giovannonii TaxID=406548 RepID=A0A5B9W1V8_9BACT|nr:hypothetical protein [Aquisphaera giovannonii]QEH34642.1 hypothetical protein OJF2_31830 [Aquisphaera giovannonii]